MTAAVSTRRCVFALVALLALTLGAPSALAVEAFDGKLQAHGFVEMQVRGLNRDFAEELDLSQWYNVINVEIEADFAPDGWGPFDLLQGYMRIEGRYDCVYSEGCGALPNARVYGNESEDLPLRLRDAEDFDFGGAIEANAQSDPTGIIRRINPTLRNPGQWGETEVVETPLSTTFDDIQNPDLYSPGLIPGVGGNLDPSCPVTRVADSVDDPLDPFDAPGCIDNRRIRTELRLREGFPGFDTLFQGEGADGEIGNNQDFEVLGTAFYDPDLEAAVGFGGPLAFDEHFRGLADLRDDPAFYTLRPVIHWRFAHREVPGALPNGVGLPMGPWLPSNRFGTLAALDDRAHPLRGRETPVHLNVDGASVRGSGVRIHELDCDVGFLRGPVDPRCPGGPSAAPYDPDPIDPRLVRLEDLLRDFGLRGFLLREFNESTAGTDVFLNVLPGPDNGVFNGVRGVTPFGGDYSGIIPCFDTTKGVGGRVVGGLGTLAPDDRHIDQLEGQVVGSSVNSRRGCIPFTNVRVQGGGGELPLRVAPDISNLLSGRGDFQAQGLYIPSPGLIRYAANGGDFDRHEFNITETERALNIGASQRDTYAVKEAYIDAEFLDSRLWIRAGIQNIVWGKTELFRTTDQFNPQDLALASLPALEESRIALLSWRAVYSLYDVGPLEDVRVELAMNFDRVKPADLGACGEPYTPDIVCGVTLGAAIHSVTGIGIAGVDRPDNGWDSVDGLEFGGRIEFRWDRFSFAIVDFYGYNDFPYPDPIFFYERNVDPDSGMPRKSDSRGRCENRAAFAVNDVFGTGGGDTVIHAGNSRLEAELREVRLSNGVSGFEGGDPPTLAERQVRGTGLEDNFSGLNGTGADDDWWRRKEAYSLLGIGTDPDCLKPGGAPDFASENRFDSRLQADPADFARYSNVDGSIDPDTYVGFTVGANGAGEATSLQWTREGFSEDYALAYHPANQQLFNFICSATVTIAVAIAPEACAWNLWGSDTLLINDSGGPPFSESFGVLFAGDRQYVGSGFLMDVVVQNTKSGFSFGFTNRQFPIATLNSDVRDGRTGATNDLYNTRELIFGIVRRKDQARDVFDVMTLDNSLTWQQKALLGCGPAYGTRCDSGSAAVRVRIEDCVSAANPRCPILPGNTPAAQAALVGLVDIENETVARNASDRYTIVKNPDTCDPSAMPGDPLFDTTGQGCVCPPEDLSECRIWGRGGGVDFLNAEASVIVQSFSGFDGTAGRTRTDYDIETWVTWARDTPQPGTIGLSGIVDDMGAVEREPEPFEGGVVCSRYAPDSEFANSRGLVTLPGCRGATSANVNRATREIEVVFDDFYSPHVDGCMFGRSMTNQAGDTYYVKAFNSDGSENSELQNELFETCFNNNAATIVDPDAPGGVRTNIHAGDPSWFSYTRTRAANIGVEDSTPSFGAGHLFHPLAQCEQAGPARSGTPAGEVDRVFNPNEVDADPGSVRSITLANNLCQTLFRDYENDFLAGNAQVFRNELAAVSFNLQTFLTISSCNSSSGGDDLSVQECFDPERPWAAGRCSFSAPHYCRNVKGFLGVAGLGRNDARAGGNPNFGRRDFIWHSGGEVILDYQRRNVFGFSADFAEDVTKTNWGMEFTWIGPTPWGDNNSRSGTTASDSFNLTISVDRPTFINFLNANRTFFFNTQWFFNYIPEHGPGFTTFGDPFNVLFTFAVFTGYYQDRFLPRIVTVYDFGSRTGGFLPELQYRFTEAFSITFGVSFFIGRNEYLPMPVRGFAPNANRGGRNPYQDGVTRLLTLISRRDEAWLRLRWTF